MAHGYSAVCLQVLLHSDMKNSTAIVRRSPDKREFPATLKWTKKCDLFLNCEYKICICSAEREGA